MGGDLLVKVSDIWRKTSRKCVFHSISQRASVYCFVLLFPEDVSGEQRRSLEARLETYACFDPLPTQLLRKYISYARTHLNPVSVYVAALLSLCRVRILTRGCCALVKRYCRMAQSVCCKNSTLLCEKVSGNRPWM